MNTRSMALFLVAGLAGACGGSGASDDTPDLDAGPGLDANTGTWKSLMEGDWSLAPGEEGYFCVYATVPRDMYIKAFRPIIPLGTHHTVLTRYTGSHADGVERCDVGTNGQSMIYGSGVGSPDFVFPTGVGLHFTTGQKLLLNLHLYNASDEPLTGRSGTLFQEGTAADVQHLAEVVLAGPTITLRVPMGVSTQTGTCNLSSVTDEPIQVFAMSQHMHKLGRNLKTTIARGNQTFTMQDIPYNFEQQLFQLTAPTIELRPGDVLTTHCSYDNDTGHVVTFGESSNDEMCFSDLFYYPAQGANFVCSGF